MLNTDTESSTTSESESDSRSEYSTSTRTSTSESSTTLERESYIRTQLNALSKHKSSKEKFASFVTAFFNLLPDDLNKSSRCKKEAERIAERYHEENCKEKLIEEFYYPSTTLDQDIVNFSKFLEKQYNIKFFRNSTETTKENKYELFDNFLKVLENILNLSDVLIDSKKFSNTINTCKKILKPKRDFWGHKIKPMDKDFFTSSLIEGSVNGVMYLVKPILESFIDLSGLQKKKFIKKIFKLHMIVLL